MTGTGNPALTVWVLDPDANDLAAMFGDAYCAEHKGVYLRVEGTTWTADVYEQVIRGAYPGYPDTDEYHVGHGECASQMEARWQAVRAAERFDVRQDAIEWDMTVAIEHGNPDGDPDWWKAPVTP